MKNPYPSSNDLARTFARTQRRRFAVALLSMAALMQGAGLAQVRADAPPVVGAVPKGPAPLPTATLLPSIRTTPAAIRITPDRDNWTYALGEPASFRIVANVTPFPAEGVPVKYRVGPEMREGSDVSVVVPAEGLKVPVTSPEAPGLIRCIVTATIDGKTVRDIATVAYAPEKLTPTQTDPSDFDAFWAEQKAALAKVPPEYKLTPVPEVSNGKVDVYQVSFQNVGGWAGPSRFYGVLCVPKGDGPFPAVLSVPGAGVRPYSGLWSLAMKGCITLQVGIHGIPVNLPPELYDSLGKGALQNYPRFGLDDRQGYYYRRVYLGCLRAADYLTTHPKWDGKNLVVMGGSQGGQLSIVTAALEPRITALAANYPAYSDVTGYLRGTTGGWPALFRTGRDGKVADAPIEDKVITTGYYDTVNFARRLKVPGHYFWGYNDETCPATSIFAAYNIITAPKEAAISLEQGHRTNADQNAIIDAWVLKTVGLK